MTTDTLIYFIRPNRIEFFLLFSAGVIVDQVNPHQEGFNLEGRKNISIFNLI